MRHLLANIELSMVHGTPHIFFRNKTFLFVKIEIQHPFDLEFRETLQNFSSFRQIFRRRFSMGNKSCPNELPSLHGKKSFPTPKFLGMAEACFVCHIGPNFQISLIYAFIGCP